MKTERPSTLSQTAKPLVFCLSTVFVLWCATNTYGQAVAPAPSPLDLDKVTAFRPLFDEREKLQDEVQDLADSIADLAEKLKIARKPAEIERDIKQWERDIEVESDKKNADEAALTSLKNYLATLNEELQTANKGPDALEAQRKERTQKKQRLSQVEQKIAALTDDKRDLSTFRAISTGAFSLLVAVVVGGFYLIAWFKDGIAAKIFAGEMGMQFVTLFLIVIAIILFGIMGTLEGRELAALLGGLSGYILGKASAKTGGNGSDSNSGGQNQQQQNQHQESVG